MGIKLINNYSKILSVIKGTKTTSKAVAYNKKKKLIVDVAMYATKEDIKRAVKLLFGVPVISVNTIIVKGKEKMYGRRHRYKGVDKKKAILCIGDVAMSDKDSMKKTESLMSEAVHQSDQGIVK